MSDSFEHHLRDDLRDNFQGRLSNNLWNSLMDDLCISFSGSLRDSLWVVRPWEDDQ
jgi:hypothetical protein